MKPRLTTIICSVLIGVAALSSQSFAQQKTVKACEDEWRANKAANQAKGITEKAYVVQCRAGGSTAQPVTPATPPAAKSATPAPLPAATAPAVKKTAKACEDEWRANKAANQARGITEKAYVVQCRAGGATAQPVAPAAPPAAKSATPAPVPAATAPAVQQTPTARPAPAAATAPTGVNQFSTEALAKARCPADTVVWVNLSSRIYHYAGNRDYGKTKRGAYMCEKDTAAANFRAAKNEKRPS